MNKIIDSPVFISIFSFILGILSTIFLQFILKPFLENRGSKKPILSISNFRWRSDVSKANAKEKVELFLSNIGVNPVKEFAILYKEESLFMGQSIEAGNLWSATIALPISDRMFEKRAANNNFIYPIKVYYKDFHNNTFLSEYIITVKPSSENPTPKLIRCAEIVRIWHKPSIKFPSVSP